VIVSPSASVDSTVISAVRSSPVLPPLRERIGALGGLFSAAVSPPSEALSPTQALRAKTLSSRIADERRIMTPSWRIGEAQGSTTIARQRT
jgi:hypothetical protein